MARKTDTDRILYEIERVRLNTVEILKRFPEARSLGPFIAAIHGRRCKMAVNVPVPNLIDTEEIDLSVMPRKRDGHVSVDATVTWTADAGGEVVVGRIVDGVLNTDPFEFNDPQFPGEAPVTCPASFNCIAKTPGASGSYKVTASGTDSEGAFEPAEFGPISWVSGQPRSLNASVGSPRAEV